MIKQLDNPLLSTPFKEMLPESKKALDQYYHEVNKRIENGDNKSVEVDLSEKIPKIILKYNKKEDLANHQFFKTLSKVSIIDVLNFVLKKTNFLSKFPHIKPHGSKAKQDVQYILGVVIANAMHQGIGGMSTMSNLDYQTLFNAEHNFIRLDTLRPGCDAISNGTSILPLFSHWFIENEKIYAAVDGQKFQTRFDIPQ